MWHHRRSTAADQLNLEQQVLRKRKRHRQKSRFCASGKPTPEKQVLRKRKSQLQKSRFCASGKPTRQKSRLCASGKAGFVQAAVNAPKSRHPEGSRVISPTCRAGLRSWRNGSTCLPASAALRLLRRARQGPHRQKILLARMSQWLPQSHVECQ